MIFSQDGPLPLEAYGALSPILVDKEAEFEFVFEDDGWDLLEKWMNGEIVRPEEIPKDWKRLDQYLDVPMLRDDWESRGDSILWLYRRRGYSLYKGLSADSAAENGHLETLKWIRANGGEWTTDAADNAAENGHLETLQWIRDNGGGMSEPQISNKRKRKNSRK